MEEIRIGKKSKGEYISAILWAFRNSHDSVIVAGLGTCVSKTFNIVEDVVEALDDVNRVDTEIFEKEGLQGVRIKLEREAGQDG